MSSFNLIDERWIPVRFCNGSLGELGIRETFARATEVAAIEDQSPLVTAALHRLLLAVLYRALRGPTDPEHAKALFREGLPQSSIADYLVIWYGRFFLFDEAYPFWQVADFVPKHWRAWTVLAAEHNADNAKVLFDHINVESPGTISPAAAARWLAAVQTFALAAANSELGYTRNSASATSLMAIPLGLSLHDTLLFNLVHETRAVLPNDLPVWERPAETVASLVAGPERLATGFADLYTWRTRAIVLASDADGRVGRVGLAAGVGYTPGVLSDPMVAYRMDKKLGRLPRQLRDRGIWREFDSLMPDDSGHPPLVMSHAATLARTDKSHRLHAVLVIGQKRNEKSKAKIDFWRGERFSLPEIIATDGTTRAQIKGLLDKAAFYETDLYKATRSFALDLVIRGARPLKKDDLKNADKVAKQTGVTQRYWSELEPRFHGLLASYAADREFEDIRAEWLLAIRESLRGSWQMHADAIAFSDAWSIRALVKAEKHVRRALGTLESEIHLLTATEVVE